jgi:hypothetical protein
VSVDPAIHVALRLGLALLFLDASLHKLRDFAAFRAALAGYALVPRWGVAAAATGLVGFELGVAAALVVPAAGGAPALAAAALLALYAGAIGVNLARGRRDIACGCAGPASRRPLGAGLVVRNLALAGLALAAALPSGARPLHPVDVATVAGLAAAGALLYAAADRALALAPPLAALRGRS